MLYFLLEMYIVILALRECVSRGHEMETRPSVVRVAIIREPIEQISFKF